MHMKSHGSHFFFHVCMLIKKPGYSSHSNNSSHSSRCLTAGYTRQCIYTFRLTPSFFFFFCVTVTCAHPCSPALARTRCVCTYVTVVPIWWAWALAVPSSLCRRRPCLGWLSAPTRGVACAQQVFPECYPPMACFPWWGGQRALLPEAWVILAPMHRAALVLAGLPSDDLHWLCSDSDTMFD